MNLINLNLNNKGFFLIVVAFIFVMMFLSLISLDYKLNAKREYLKESIITNNILNTKKAVLSNNIEALIKKNVENTLLFSQKTKVIKQNLKDLKRNFDILDINIDLNSAEAVLDIGNNKKYNYKITFLKPTYKDLNINNKLVKLEIKTNTVFAEVFYGK